MLVLQRDEGQRIVIGEPGNQVVITYCGQTKTGVRIGIQANRDTNIYREEIYTQMHSRPPDFPNKVMNN